MHPMEYVHMQTASRIRHGAESGEAAVVHGFFTQSRVERSVRDYSLVFLSFRPYGKYSQHSM